MNDIIYVGKHSLTLNVTLHEHSSWELVYCTEGEGVFHFGEQLLPYRQGDVVVIPPYTPHSNESDKGFTNIHINMANPTLNFSGPVLIRDDSNAFIRSAFEAAFYHYSSAPGKPSILLSTYGDLVAYYMAAFHTASPRSRVVEEIESSILKNYPDCSYELDSYLHSLPFSYDYLRKLFKKELGVTPHKYLNDKRLQTAAESLSADFIEGGSISEIARLCGFREPLYFSRMFKKKYGVSPTRYHEMCVEREVPATPESVRILLEDA